MYNHQAHTLSIKVNNVSAWSALVIKESIHSLADPLESIHDILSAQRLLQLHHESCTNRHNNAYAVI